MAAHNVVIHGKDATTGLPTDIEVINNAASVALSSGGAVDKSSGTLPLGSSVSVGETLTKIAEFSLSGVSLIEIAVTGYALDQFEIRGKAVNGSEITLKSTAADYANPSGILVGSDDELPNAQVGSVAILLEPGVQTYILYAASSNAAGSGVTVYA